jgi:hypothetical protein
MINIVSSYIYDFMSGRTLTRRDLCWFAAPRFISMAAASSRDYMISTSPEKIGSLVHPKYKIPGGSN